MKCDDETLAAITENGVDLDEASADPNWCITSSKDDFAGGRIRSFLGRTAGSKLLFVVVAQEAQGELDLIWAEIAEDEYQRIYDGNHCRNWKERIQ